MDFATGALGTLLPKLAQLLKDEYNLQEGVKKDIEFLSKELESMGAALRKVGEVQTEDLDELQRIWARDARELSYDMEDIVDTFMVRVEGPDPLSNRLVKRIFKKMIKKVTKATTRHGIAKEIVDIKERMRQVAERRDRCKVDAIAPAKVNVDPRITALYTKVTELVGIDEAREEIITRLTKGDQDGDQQKRIVSIAGFGGLGKTTLAKAVYDEIKGQFDCTAFVSVSRNPDTRKVLKSMLYELDKEKFKDIFCSNFDEIKPLIDLVIEFLQKKRYLIVLDDIWDMEPWHIMECALIENNKGSRIITTTRIIGVADQIGGCYKLQTLSDKSSEILFYGRTFGSHECPREFFEVSKKILKKCGGVPLAIITTSSLLANKTGDIDEWYDVRNSIGQGLGNNPGMKSMKKILLLSYYDLPSHLKTCLLYLSIFPEDYEIRKGQLISRWLAEGFVHQGQGGQTLLEIGENYFNELLNRSLIQPADMDMEGTPHACRVHDTVLDLIISLSAEECFATTVLGDGKHSLDIKVRRLSLLNATTDWPTVDMPKLRSITIFEPSATVIDLLPSFSRYNLLRVLDLGGSKLKDLASLGFVGALSHLRYLGLSSVGKGGSDEYGSDRLPMEIGKLQFLQTLDLSETDVGELPLSIIGLRHLICLHCAAAYYCDTMLPEGLKNITSLEVLESATITSKSIARELGYLTQLRVLKVKLSLPQPDDDRESCYKALVESLGKLDKLEYLDICDKNDRSCRLSVFEGNHSFSLDGSVKPLKKLRWLLIQGGSMVPEWIKPAFLPVLSYLDIYLRCVRSGDIQVLGTLPALRHLKVFTTGTMLLKNPVVRSGAFPVLVKCEFDTPGVVPSMFPRGAMPMLEDLTFIAPDDMFSGGEYTVGDLGLSHLPSLGSVIVGFSREVSKDMKTRVREKLEHEAAVHPKRPRIHTKLQAFEVRSKYTSAVSKQKYKREAELQSIKIKEAELQSIKMKKAELRSIRKKEAELIERQRQVPYQKKVPKLLEDPDTRKMKLRATALRSEHTHVRGTHSPSCLIQRRDGTTSVSFPFFFCIFFLFLLLTFVCVFFS